jgi:hypothetical protein
MLLTQILIEEAKQHRDQLDSAHAELAKKTEHVKQLEKIVTTNAIANLSSLTEKKTIDVDLHAVPAYKRPIKKKKTNLKSTQKVSALVHLIKKSNESELKKAVKSTSRLHKRPTDAPTHASPTLVKGRSVSNIIFTDKPSREKSGDIVTQFLSVETAEPLDGSSFYKEEQEVNMIKRVVGSNIEAKLGSFSGLRY